MAHWLLVIKATIGGVIATVAYSMLMIELHDVEPSFYQHMLVGGLISSYIFFSGAWEMANWE